MKPPRPYWTLMSRLFRPEDCATLIAAADGVGWRTGTYADGRTRDNVHVCFLRPDQSPLAAAWIDALRFLATPLGALFGVQVHPAGLVSIQVSRWGPGDYYGMHSDHGPEGTLPHHRKLTIYVSLSDGGGLEIEGRGMVQCSIGSALAFNALVRHAAPEQPEDAPPRFSVAAWVPGEDWT